MLLSLDIGTTHCKAATFDLNGRLVATAIRPTTAHNSAEIGPYYDPEILWSTCLDVIADVLAGQVIPVQALGITSMAETGMLVDMETGAARTALLPWFNRQAVSSLWEQISADPEQLRERFLLTGIWPSYKASLFKLLWLKENRPEILPGSAWISAAGFVAQRLTGKRGCAASLAGRTYAYRIDRGQWDSSFLAELGLEEVHLPPALSGGTPVGRINEYIHEPIGLPKGLPVTIAGHDHLCAAFGVHAALDNELTAPPPGQAFDSMGTAEILVGTLPETDRRQSVLDERAYQSRLSYGSHVMPGQHYWLGGLSASGGSLEWVRSILGQPALDYAEIEQLAGEASRPTGILYFPYLAGRGSPHTAPAVRAAFLGLDAAHTRADLVASILEGTAFELEFIRQTALTQLGLHIDQLIASGGGTRNATWMQIKADVSGIPILVPDIEEAALLGAALLAGYGSGLLAQRPGLEYPATHLYQPDWGRNAAYQNLFQNGFMRMQAALEVFTKFDLP